MATSANRKFLLIREIQEFFKNVKNISQGQAEAENFEFNDVHQEHFISLYVTPNDGIYKGARMKFQIRLPRDYPAESPFVYCLDKVYHPNIDLPDLEFGLGGSVCVNTIDSDWHPTVGLDGVVLSILFLFHQPNLDDPLSPVFDSNVTEKELAENVKLALRGHVIEGVRFDKLLESREMCNTECSLSEGLDKKSYDDSKGWKFSSEGEQKKLENLELRINTEKCKPVELEPKVFVPCKDIPRREIDIFQKLTFNNLKLRFDQLVAYFGGCCTVCYEDQTKH